MAGHVCKMSSWGGTCTGRAKGAVVLDLHVFFSHHQASAGTALGQDLSIQAAAASFQPANIISSLLLLYTLLGILGVISLAGGVLLLVGVAFSLAENLDCTAAHDV